MSEQKQPSVIRFEQEVAAKNYEAACVELLDILGKIDSNFGGIEGTATNSEPQKSDDICPFLIESLKYIFLIGFPPFCGQCINPSESNFLNSSSDIIQFSVKTFPFSNWTL